MTIAATYSPGPNVEDVTIEKDGGILKEILVSGGGEDSPWTGDKVYVHYVGTLQDGSKFDSSRDRGEKFSFNIGKSEVIKGWDQGVASMKVGEKAMFTIRADYGYGSAGSPPKIPGDATLIFEIELFEFHGEDVTKDKDLGVVKRIKVNGEGWDVPNDGAQIELQLKGSANGKVFDDRTVKFEVGEGLEENIPRGVEIALEKMKKNEVAQVTVKPGYGFGSNGCADKGIGPNATLQYEMKVISFEKAKESWQLDADAKLEQARIFKDKGTKHFKNSKYEIAASRYQKIVDFLEHEISLKGEGEVERKSLLQAGRLNLAQCHLKTGNWTEARSVCSKAIEENGQTSKALFRRGEAQLALNDCEAAKNDFEKCLSLEPDNKAAKNKVTICQQKIKAQKEKEKKTFANMFDRFAEIDKKKEELERKKNARPDAMNHIDEWEGSDGTGIATDPNSIKVGGDIKMDIDLNEAIKEDAKLQED